MHKTSDVLTAGHACLAWKLCHVSSKMPNYRIHGVCCRSGTRGSSLSPTTSRFLSFPPRSRCCSQASACLSQQRAAGAAASSAGRCPAAPLATQGQHCLAPPRPSAGPPIWASGAWAAACLPQAIYRAQSAHRLSSRHSAKRQHVCA